MTRRGGEEQEGRWWALAAGVFLAILGYFTYVRGYDYPPNLFWDENYHITSAQRYLNGVHSLENHPPLGKLFIALGEWIVDADSDDGLYVGTSYMKGELPETFSFRGYRLFPTIFAWLTAPLIFFALYLVSHRTITAAFLTCAYVFDNAVIVHSRGAMLESTQVFFLVAAAAALLWLDSIKPRRPMFLTVSFLCGLFLGAAFMTKLTSVILLVAVVAFAIRENLFSRRAWEFLGAFAVGFLLISVAVWKIHFALGTRIDPRLDKDGYYSEDPTFRALVEQGQHGTFAALPTMLRGYYLEYMPRYNKNVPILNLCKADENGSPAYLWPVGARAINYRWEKVPGMKDFYRYLYLQVNPAIWWALLGALIVGVSLCVVHYVLGPARSPLRYSRTLSVLVLMYFGYLASVTMLGRVMYLYHYFVPLLISLFIAAIVIEELVAVKRLEREIVELVLSLWMLVVVLTYLAYSPLTYYRPISHEQIKRLSLLTLWDLRCQSCQRTNFLANPGTVPANKKR